MRVGILGVGHWHAGMHATGVLEAGAEIAGVWDQDVGLPSRASWRRAAARRGLMRPRCWRIGRTC